jgi:hypothetical protein
MIQTDISVMLLDPGFNETSCLPIAELPTFAGDDLHTWCFHVEFILDGLKETGILPRWEANSFDAIF